MKIADEIKYEGDNSTFIWKYPGEDFNTLSQLIVHESQEALLFLNGQALDLFGPGRHTLHTSNIPLINRILNIPTGGESSFHCEVYFINKTEQMAIKWGVGDVNFCDPTHNDYAFKIGASGEMSVRVNDSRKTIVKLVGTETIFDRESVEKYFKASITTHIKTLLPNILREKRVSIFDVESCLSELSDILKAKISDEMADYGIVLEKLWVNTVKKPEEDPTYITLNRQRAEKITVANQGEIDIQRADYRRQIEIINHTGEDQKRRMDIDTKHYADRVLDISEREKLAAEIAKYLAQNPGPMTGGAGGFSAIIGGSPVRPSTDGVAEIVRMMLDRKPNQHEQPSQNMRDDTPGMEPVTPPAQDDSFGGTPGMINLKEEASTQTENNDGEMGAATDGEMDAFDKRLDRLCRMKNKGILSEAEFDAEKNSLLAEIRRK